MSKDYLTNDDQEYSNWYEKFIRELCQKAADLMMIKVIEGIVPANAMANITEGPFNNNMVVILENTGTSLLRFCISNSITGSCPISKGVVVNPSEVITTNIDALGGDRGNYLNVSSSSSEVPPVEGNFKVTSPSDELKNFIAHGQPVIEKIISTGVKRNQWKEEAEIKNTLKDSFIKNELRPYVQHKIKANDNYTLAMGKDMGIVDEKIPIDFSTLKPIIKLTLKPVGIEVGYIKGVAEGLRIEVDRNDGKGYVLVGISMHPNFNDTTPLPAIATVWKYRAVYIIKEIMVGQWSAIEQIIVVN